MAGEEDLREKLKNMTPEEFAKFQKENCIYCQLISGKIPAKKVYEDDKCAVLLEIKPASKGHVIILPKEHYNIMPMVPQDVLNHMFKLAKRISKIMLRSFKAKGTTLFVANGPAAGQIPDFRFQHFLINIIPRYEGYPINSLKIPENKISKEDLDAIRQKLSARIGYKPKAESETEKAEVKEESYKDEVKVEKKKAKKKPKKEKEETEEEADDIDDNDVDDKIDEAEDVDLDEIARLLG
ncbi:HIT domain-containing protein [Candidatus Woesearchaeota archaeon]|nr:HIT domain-containing protein [Candidatus Woesearchaeota archaeon]